MIPGGGGLSSVPVPGAFLPPDDQLPVTNPNPDPDGPTIPTDWEMGGAALNDPSQGLEIQTWTFYLAGETIMVKPATGPAVAFYVAGPGVTELTGSFDSNMNPIAAFIANGTAWLWWWNSLISGYQLSSLPAMTSPRLTLDDKRATQVASRSVLLFYIRDGQVCYRQSGERYQVEYQLYPVPAGYVALSRVGMADNRRVQIELRSDWIPPPPLPPQPPPPCVGDSVDAVGCNNAAWCLPRPPVPVWPVEPCHAPAWSLPPPCTPVDWAPLPPWDPTMPCEHPPVSVAVNQFTYITINGETQVLTPGAVQLVSHTTGVLPIDRGGTGAVSAEAVRVNLGLGTAAVMDANAFATAAQGVIAVTALQPGNDAAALGSGAAIPAGYGLLADGAGGADWGAIAGGGGGGIPEAPLSGGPYGRKAAAWVDTSQNITPSGDANNKLIHGTDQRLYVAPGVTDHGALTGLTDPDHPIAAVSGLQTALDAKAPLASPALTGVPTAPTAPTTTSTTQIATTAFALTEADRIALAAVGVHSALPDPHPGYVLDADFIIPASVTLYIATTGNDSTGDGTLAKPWLTLAKAFAYLSGKAIAIGATVTIDIGAGNHNWTGTLAFAHPYGSQINIRGAARINAITGIVQADFTAPVSPVPGTRGTYDLYNSAGMLATNANAAARTAARAVDAPQNLTLLQSVYPTRITPATGVFSLECSSALGGLQDILFERGRLISNAKGLIVAGTLAFASNDTGAAVLAQNGGSITATRLIVSNSQVGVHCYSGRILCNSMFIQGCVSDSCRVQLDSVLTIAEVIGSGCGGTGLLATVGGTVVVSEEPTLIQEMSLSGNGGRGLHLAGDAAFTWNSGGAGGNILKLQGNTTEQCLVVGNSRFSLSPSAVTLSIQAATTSPGMSLSTNSSFISNSAASINAGTNSIVCSTGSVVSLAGNITITDSVTPVLQRPIFARGGTVLISGTLAVPAALGSIGVVADRHGTISEVGSVLLGLNATVPTKFTPRLGQFSTEGSLITSGPATTAALTLLSTAVTLSGSSVKLAALAGTGTRQVQVQADGTLIAV